MTPMQSVDATAASTALPPASKICTGLATGTARVRRAA